MIVKLLTEYHLEFLSLKGGCRGSSESTQSCQNTTLLEITCHGSYFLHIVVMMTITTEDYEKLYWPKLEQAISQLLTMAPGQYIPISYEQMYR